MNRIVAVTLQQNAAYVTGTVNGASAVWTNIEDTTWETTVARSSDDIYQVHIMIVDFAGNATAADFSIYYGLQLVIDRVLADLVNDTDKGYYQAEDMNRVGQAMQQILNRLKPLGYGCNIIPKIDWHINDTPTVPQLLQYLKNVRIVRDRLQITNMDIPPLPNDMEDLTIEEANNIERILMIVDQSITRMIQNFVYCNEIFCNEF